MRTALVNGRVLTAAGFVDDLAVVIEDGTIVDVVAREHASAPHMHDLQGRMLAPGFIDCQVNGGGGVLFNDAPTVETIRRIAQAHRRFGTTGLLPTLISDNAVVMRAAIDAVAAAIAQGVAGVLGIHLEGPFLATQKKGIHDSAKFRLPDAADIALIASGKSGRVVLTIAPEEVPPDIVARIIESRCRRCRRTHGGNVRANARFACGGLARIYASVQCDVAAAKPRTRRRRRGAGRQ